MVKKIKFLYSDEEANLFKSLNSSKKIQDYLNTLKFNFEQRGDTCYSPRFVIQKKTAHCMEGAMFAAAVLEFHGQKPLVLDLRSEAHDFDHVLAVFQQFGSFGAISKTNHAVLRYREPIYKSIRELAMSYFHEYFDDKGRKTLREYSRPFDLRYFDHHPLLISPLKGEKKGKTTSKQFPSPRGGGLGWGEDWRTSPKNLFQIPDYLDEIKHFDVLSPRQIKNLRKADKIEIKAGELVEWKNR